MDFLIFILAFYFGIGIYEFYKSFLMGQPTRECVINGLVWPVEVYYEVRDLIKRNYIDKEGP